MWKSTAALLVIMSACSSDDGSDSGGDDAATTEDGASTSTADASSSDSGGSTDLLPETESSGGEDPTSIDATLSAGSSSESGGGVDCTTLDPAACERTETCMTINASPFVPDASRRDAWCLDTATPVACRNADDNCDALLTYACDEKGTAYEVGSDCIPRPWSICDPPMMGAPDC